MKRLLTLLAVFVVLAEPVLAQPGTTQASATDGSEPICRMVEDSARQYHLPIQFLTRLVWTESAFDIDAISPAGAQGVAQFMPGTASERGLTDPLNPQLALVKAAEYLAALTDQFGNLGLAAAAYNGGPARVGHWLDGQGDLAGETRLYVYMITGQPVEYWAKAGRQLLEAQQAATTPAAEQSCLQQVKTLSRQGRPRFARGILPTRLPTFETRLAGYLDKVLARQAPGPQAAAQPMIQPPSPPGDLLITCGSPQAIGSGCAVERQ
ncbi:MAG: lytic transglycosylase domain-containing protein [Alphaproteobacteria bacterium]|nr:lytic transglycosylase domain-containing protein [Alphaproteobacteria bacterium]